MKGFYHKILYTLGISVITIGLQAQSLDQAKKLYTEGQYSEAKPAFERLIKTAPNNASYNLWYGVCCYETQDYTTAEKHLTTAAKKKVLDAPRYLAELYYKTYRFNEAVKMYDEYMELLTKKKMDTEAWELKQEEATRAARMLSKTEDIQIIDSVVIHKDDFLNAYNLSSESGSLQPFNQFFETSTPNESAVYLNEKGNKIYYAEKEDGGNYKLYTQSKLLDKWGDKKQLPSNINSKEDNNYPFVLSDGATIYFSSKGNQSIGGYDLFVTRYNSGNESYLSPDQLGMPFNSLSNDYMMVIDEAKGLGWFASDRNQPEGNVVVYLFIPNENRKDLIIQSEDDAEIEQIKRDRAMITSIKDSWIANTDYSDAVKLAHTDLSAGLNTVKKEFNFVISDNLIYYTLSQIQSPEAQKIYEKALTTKKQINALSAKLDELRQAYKEDKAKRPALTPEILKVEKQIESLSDQPMILEKNARNIEINYLKK